jgi:hypothetical protein
MVTRKLDAAASSLTADAAAASGTDPAPAPVILASAASQLSLEERVARIERYLIAQGFGAWL